MQLALKHLSFLRRLIQNQLIGIKSWLPTQLYKYLMFKLFKLEKNVDVVSFQMLTAVFDGPQASPACPSDMSSINTRMNMEF
jgi:hypothetical protein